jgi:hypothetical protein
MSPRKRSELAVVLATSEPQFIEQFGPLLGIHDSAALRCLQTASLHVVFTIPVARGRSEVRYQGMSEVLLTTGQPLLDTARLLLSLGCRPDAIIARRRVGADADDMRAPLSVAARYTVDETKTVFAKWKPFCQSAVPARDAARGSAASGVAPTAELSQRRDRRHENQVQPDCLDPTDNEQIRP